MISAEYHPIGKRLVVKGAKSIGYKNKVLHSYISVWHSKCAKWHNSCNAKHSAECTNWKHQFLGSPLNFKQWFKIYKLDINTEINLTITNIAVGLLGILTTYSVILKVQFIQQVSWTSVYTLSNYCICPFLSFKQLFWFVKTIQFLNIITLLFFIHYFSSYLNWCSFIIHIPG